MATEDELKEFTIDRLCKVWARAGIKAHSVEEAKAIFDKREKTGEIDDNIVWEDFITDSPEELMAGSFERDSEDGLWWSYNPIADRYKSDTYVVMLRESVKWLTDIEGFMDNVFLFHCDENDMFDGRSYLVSLKWLEEHADEINWDFV